MSGGGGGKGGSSVTIGYRYYMSILMGFCRGPIDELKAISAGDKEIFPLDQPTVTGTGTYFVNAGQVFGGDKGEGGVEGNLTFLMGDPDQFAPGWLKTGVGGNVSDFRGVAVALFDGLICALNPYPKKWKFRLRRTVGGWDGPVWEPTLATIWLESFNIKAMNPAHILYECATNRDWGRGFPREIIDNAAWRAAAITLYNEEFGLCLRWNRQGTLQEFVQSVLDHIGGSIFVDRQTGLLTLKLLRNDYVPADVPLFDYNSGLLSMDSGETAARDKSVNEVIVKYHTPLGDEDREVRAQNLASIQSVGAINSTTTDYTGVPTHTLAARLAQRDLRINTTATRRFKVKLDRRAWRIYPGAVFRVSAPDKGIANLILRAGKITDGSPTSGEITVEAVIDVFGLPSAAFVEQQEPEWVPPDSTPSIVTDRIAREATYFDMFNRLSPSDLALFDVHSGAIATVAAKPTSLTLNYGISTRTGTDTFVERSRQTFAPSMTLASAIGHYDTTITFEAGVDMGLIEVGSLMQIGNELLRLDDIAVDASGVAGTLTVARGCIDTVPQTHALGAQAFILVDAIGSDQREYATGESVNVKMLSITNTGTLASGLAPVDTVNIGGRQGRPYPPGRVRINGTPAFDVSSVTGALVIQWAHRDRLLQKDQIVDHEEPNVGPEAGTTYTIRIFSGSGTLLTTAAGLTGTSYTVSLGLTGALRFELESIRDGLPSTQMYDFSLTRS